MDLQESKRIDISLKGLTMIQATLWSFSRWGICVASQMGGRGQGSRSFMHHLRRGVVMHDASYWACLSLEGNFKQLVQLLEVVRWN